MAIVTAPLAHLDPHVIKQRAEHGCQASVEHLKVRAKDILLGYIRDVRRGNMRPFKCTCLEYNEFPRIMQGHFADLILETDFQDDEAGCYRNKVIQGARLWKNRMTKADGDPNGCRNRILELQLGGCWYQVAPEDQTEP